MTDPQNSPNDGSGPPISFLDRHRISPVLFAFISLFIVFVSYQLVGGTLTYLLVGTATITRENVDAFRLLTMAGQLVFILVPTFLLARLISPRITDMFPWRIPSFMELVFAILGLFFLQQIFQIYLFFQDLLPIPEEIRRILTPLKEIVEDIFKGLVRSESTGELFFVIGIVAVVPAIVEELFFRGLIQGAFERQLQKLRAALMTGVIFGIYHFNPFSVIPLIGLGCYFGFLRLRSNSVIIAMTCHFVNNVVAVLATYFSMDDEFIIGAGEGAEPHIGAVVAQLVLYALLFSAVFSSYVRITTKTDHEEK